MRNRVTLPFAADLDTLLRERIQHYTRGRPTLGPEDIGEVAWGVSTLWEGFTGKRELAGVDYLARPELLHAYLLYYVPRSYVQARLVLRHLDPERIQRVLDLGSGPGPVLRAAVDGLAKAGRTLDLTAVDHDARALELAKQVVGRPLRGLVGKLPTLPKPLTDEKFDLITMGLVLNELFPGDPEAARRRADWLLAEVWPRVSPGGYLAIIEPALKETGRSALEVRDRMVAAGLRVVAPCVRQGPCPALVKERDWCHAGIRFQAPAQLQSIGRGVGIDATDLRFTYLVFRREAAPAPIAAGESLRVVSDPLAEKGRLKFWVCGERGRVLLDRQDKHRSAANEVLAELARAELISVEGAEERTDGLRVGEATQLRRQQGAVDSETEVPGNGLR